MHFKVKHTSPGRIRIQSLHGVMSIPQADALEARLGALSMVNQAVVHERTGCAILRYGGRLSTLLEALSAMAYPCGEESAAVTYGQSGRALRRTYQDKMITLTLTRGIRMLFFPPLIRHVFTVWKALPYLWQGLQCLLHRRLQVEVLDALSIGISLLRRDFSTAGSVIFLLNVGKILEEWTHKKSIDDLARSMSLNVDKVWLLTPQGEVLTPLAQIRTGDCISVRMGGVIPLDGILREGEVLVNQASFTGESVPVARRPGARLYAGTVVEEGCCVMQVNTQSGESRYDKIVSMIEQSERLRSAAENRASYLADRLVPYSLAGSALVYLLSRSLLRALSVLMVDFSCALKLAMPLTVLSAMREASTLHATVKGGKFLENLAKADVAVFDKTGTLTHACPEVVQVTPFNGYTEEEMLRLAACLEEHFPHSMANAVVRAAQKRGLAHEELHSQVEYIVAHGIVSTVENQTVHIGSHHFIFEDQRCIVLEADREAFLHLPVEYSYLYLAIDGKLAATISIVDPLRKEAAQVVQGLRNLGIEKTVMLTGDGHTTASVIAKTLGVDEFQAEILPEDKANYVESLRQAGYTVVMVGDGINDAPALSAADVGIAINSGAAIAREISDISIAAQNLHELVLLRRISTALLRRINGNYRFVIGFNSALILLGALGILSPALSATLHNLSTLGVSLYSMTNLLPPSALLSDTPEAPVFPEENAAPGSVDL